MIDRRGRTLAAKVFVKQVGISWNLLVVGVEEDSELLVISDASIDSLGNVLLMAGSRVGWAVGCSTWPRRELGGSEVNLVVMGTNEGKCVKSLKSSSPGGPCGRIFTRGQ